MEGPVGIDSDGRRGGKELYVSADCAGVNELADKLHAWTALDLPLSITVSLYL